MDFSALVAVLGAAVAAIVLSDSEWPSFRTGVFLLRWDRASLRLSPTLLASLVMHASIHCQEIQGNPSYQEIKEDSKSTLALIPPDPSLEAMREC